MLIRAELLALGIKSIDMIAILKSEYSITVDPQSFSKMINGKDNSPKGIKIRNACWDYINKKKGK